MQSKSTPPIREPPMYPADRPTNTKEMLLMLRFKLSARSWKVGPRTEILIPWKHTETRSTLQRTHTTVSLQKRLKPSPLLPETPRRHRASTACHVSLVTKEGAEHGLSDSDII